MAISSRLRIAACAATIALFALLEIEPPRASAETASGEGFVPRFEHDVRPILKAHCFQCHGEQGEIEAGLDLRLRRLLVAGGDSGPAVVPGKPSESPLLGRVRSGEMPPGKDAKKLTPEQVATIERWIAAGAPTAAAEPQTVAAGFLITDADREFWSFRPIARPPDPRLAVPEPHRTEQVRTPIDAFLLRELEKHGEGFSPEADRRTLVRRAYFDLVGLPPAPADLDAALADRSADWFERLIERLLASPQYGERWGRHWLDVAGYADSEGYSPEDPVREHMFRYRDYVIRALNADKPFDRFVREQLAGDEMLPPPHKNLAPAQIDTLAATGLLLMAPNPLASRTRDDPRRAHDVRMSETIKLLSTALLGLSVGCAQCHDHRYDPISQEDYYRFRAIFEPALDFQRGRNPRQTLISLYTDDDRRRAAEIEAEAAKIDRRKQEFEHAAYLKVLERELEKVPAEDRAAVRAAHEAAPPKRTPEQRALLRRYPRLAFTVANLPVLDRAAAAEAAKIGAEAMRLRAGIVKEGFLLPATEAAGPPPRTFLLYRGDVAQPRAEMKPDEPAILKSGTEPVVPFDDPASPSTGRRSAYARHLTDGNHPLVARVLVNRVWMHHFGRGITATPADFGRQGDRPSHPELLDWLARRFMDDGWSLKSLHRLIMASAAYRQGDEASEALRRIDPENRLLGGYRARRLEAEVLRDSILAVSGKLNLKQFGPPVPVMRDPTGEIVVGQERLNAGLPGPPVPLGGEEFRRSIYVQVRRSRPLTLLETFDAPTMEPNCAARESSTVAPQSLMLLNNPLVVEQSRQFAERVREGRTGDVEAQVTEAWRLALARRPTADESTEAVAFLAQQAEHFRTVPKPAAPPPQAQRPARRNAIAKPSEVDPPSVVLKDPEFESLALLCQTLLSSNEFLYVD
jgi:mono/diheme cytochrome c family protein